MALCWRCGRASLSLAPSASSLRLCVSFPFRLSFSVSFPSLALALAPSPSLALAFSSLMALAHRLQSLLSESGHAVKGSCDSLAFSWKGLEDVGR